MKNLFTIASALLLSLCAPRTAAQEARFVTNRLYYTYRSVLWDDYKVEVWEARSNNIMGIAKSPDERTSVNVLIHNYSGIPATFEKISFRAMRIGTTNFSGRTYAILDCGITPEEFRLRCGATNNVNANNSTNRPAIRKTK